MYTTTLGLAVMFSTCGTTALSDREALLQNFDQLSRAQDGEIKFDTCPLATVEEFAGAFEPTGLQVGSDPRWTTAAFLGSAQPEAPRTLVCKLSAAQTKNVAQIEIIVATFDSPSDEVDDLLAANSQGQRRGRHDRLSRRQALGLV